MDVPRIDTLTEPPVVGRAYLVPTVRGEWTGSYRDWPVVGPRHNDAVCLNFEKMHYHVDWRFVGIHRNFDGRFLLQKALAAPLMMDRDGYQPHLPDPVWRVRKCQRVRNRESSWALNKAAHTETFACHFKEWAGARCKHDGRGWVCPHRGVSLADRPAVKGVITCPLHFLRIDAATGVVLAPKERPGQGELALRGMHRHAHDKGSA